MNLKLNSPFRKIFTLKTKLHIFKAQIFLEAHQVTMSQSTMKKRKVEDFVRKM